MLLDSISTNQRTEQILVDFNIMYEIDLGCCLYLYDKCDKKFLIDDIKEWTYIFLQYNVLCRKDPNPIKILFKDEYKDSTDNIYIDLLKNKYKEILSYSPRTDIAIMMYSMIERDTPHKLFINCRNVLEINKIHKITNKANIVLNETDYEKYTILYLHDLSSIIGKDIKPGLIYLYNYSLNHFNYDIENKAPGLIAGLYAGQINFQFISPYKDFIIPIG